MRRFIDDSGSEFKILPALFDKVLNKINKKMRSIQRKFNSFVSKNSFWSSYICFTETVKGKNFNKQMIHYWFYRLVEKDDYDKKDTRKILKYLVWLSINKKMAEDYTI